VRISRQHFPTNVRLQGGLRLLCAAIVLTLLQPAPILVAPGQPHSVYTEHPILGVHTRLTDEVEPWKIQRTLQLVREMGAGWIVEFFPWAYYAAADGTFAWEHPDLVIRHAHAQGIKVVARLGLTPDWARPRDTPLTYLDASSYDDLARYATAFAARYADQISAIIVGNEPNLSYEWGYRQTEAIDYVRLLQTVYPAVKAANPEILVLAGALAPTLEPAGSPWGHNDLDYLAAMYAGGAAAFFDGLAVHAYGLTFPPEAPPGPDVLNFRRIELVREVMVAYGDAETQIYVTETGWNDHPRWTKSVRPGQRSQYTIDAVSWAEENWPNVEMMAIWAFRLPAPTRSYMDYFTLVTPEFVRKPIYEVLQEFTGNKDFQNAGGP
jgi:polysaccharide biosynthesis protein PslG